MKCFLWCLNHFSGRRGSAVLVKHCRKPVRIITPTEFMQPEQITFWIVVILFGSESKWWTNDKCISESSRQVDAPVCCQAPGFGYPEN